MRSRTSKMVTMAILAALSMVLVMNIHFPILPSAAFLEYDPADVPLLIGGFMFGPIAGFVLAVIVSLIQAITVSAQSGWVGFVMHVIATGTLVIVASTVYKYKRTFLGAIIGLVLGSLAMAAVMIPSNLFFTVKFYGYPLDAVKALIPTAIIPFNLIKAFANSILTVIIYKTISKMYHKFDESKTA